MTKKSLLKDHFLKKIFKEKFIFYKPKNKINSNLLFVDRERVDTIFDFSILSLAISNKYNLNTIILSDQKKNSLITKIYKKLGYNRFVSGFSTNKVFSKPLIFFKTILYFFYSSLFTYFFGFNWLINKFNINQIYIGDLIYDTNIRYEKRFLNPKADIYFLKILFSSIFRFFLIKDYLISYNIKKILVGTETGSRNHGIALRISSKLNIKNYTFFRFDRRGISIVSHEKNYYKNGIGNISKKEFQTIAKRLNISKVNDFYLKRRKFKTDNWYSRNDHSKANTSSPEGLKFINSLSKKKAKIILYASHAFADAPHAPGSFIFNDYFEQFKETLKHARNDNKNIWIFRAHQNSRILNEKKIFRDHIFYEKKKNILLCPDNVPIQKLLDKCDVIITGRGTIGFESAALGKKVIVAGAAPYSGLDIVYQPLSQKEYFQYIKNIENLKFDSNQIKKVSRQLIYIFENSLNVKTIKTKNLYAKSNYDHYIRNFLTFDYTYDILSKNILLSQLYKKLFKII